MLIPRSLHRLVAGAGERISVFICLASRPVCAAMSDRYVHAFSPVSFAENVRVLISSVFVLSANQQHSSRSFYTELLEQNGTNKCCSYRHAVHWGVGGRDGRGGRRWGGTMSVVFLVSEKAVLREVGALFQSDKTIVKR